MSSTPNAHRLALAVSVGLFAASAVVGCQSKSGQKGPFTDVTDRDRNQSTYAAATQGQQQPTTPAAPQTPPPEPSEAARMQSAQLPPTTPPDAAETARAEREVRQAPTPAANTTTSTNITVAMDPGDAVADRTGRPTTQGTNAIRIDQWGGARRDWGKTNSERPSGDVLAGPYYWPRPLTDRYAKQEWHRGWLEPVDFLINTVMLPVRAVQTPPDRKIVYSPIQDSSTSPAATDAPTPAEGVPPGARSALDEQGGSYGDRYLSNIPDSASRRYNPDKR